MAGQEITREEPLDEVALGLRLANAITQAVTGRRFIVIDTAFGMVLSADHRRTSGSLEWNTERAFAKRYDSRIGAEHVIREWTLTWDAPIPARYRIEEVSAHRQNEA